MKDFYNHVKGLIPTYLLLGIVGFFMAYWLVFKTGYVSQIVWTLVGVAVLSGVYLGILYYRWRKTQ